MSDLAQKGSNFIGANSSKRCGEQLTGAKSDLHEC